MIIEASGFTNISQITPKSIDIGDNLLGLDSANGLSMFTASSIVSLVEAGNSMQSMQSSIAGLISAVDAIETELLNADLASLNTFTELVTAKAGVRSVNISNESEYITRSYNGDYAVANSAIDRSGIYSMRIEDLSNLKDATFTELVISSGEHKGYIGSNSISQEFFDEIIINPLKTTFPRRVDLDTAEVYISNLPTALPLQANRLWVDAGVLKVSTI